MKPPGTGGRAASLRELEQTLRRTLLSEIELDAFLGDEEILSRIDDLILSEQASQLVSLKEREEMRASLFNSVRRLDVLQELVDDEEVTEIMVNGHQTIFVERQGRIRRFEKSFLSGERLYDVIQQIAGRCDRIVNEQHPIADARLENGARVSIVLPPVALGGAVLTIRRFPKEVITMEKLISLGSVTREAASFLEQAVRGARSILVGGGTSTGKTTFLNALAGYIPSDERIITIEDNAELQIRGIDNLVRLEVREANLAGEGAITIRDLIRTALRMRPNRIIIGEVRGAEALDWLSCLNTGHAGSLGSAHANSVRDMIGRLETMVRMGADLPLHVIRRQIVTGVDLFLHLTREADGTRRLAEIAEVIGMEDDEIKLRTLFCRDEDGRLKKTDGS